MIKLDYVFNQKIVMEILGEIQLLKNVLRLVHLIIMPIKLLELNYVFNCAHKGYMLMIKQNLV